MSKVSNKQIENWLIKRGLPHFIHEYSATKDILTRALPYLIVIFIVELFFVGDVSGERSLVANIAILFGVVILIL